MNVAVNVAKNSAMLFIASLVERLSSIVFIAVLVRSVSPDDFAIYTLVVTFFEFGSLLADLGMSQVITRDVAQAQDHGSTIWSNSLSLGALWSLLAWIAVGATGLILGYTPEVSRLIWLVGGGLGLRVVWLFSGAVLRAFERMEIVSAVNSGQAIFYASTAILCLVAGLSVRAILYAMILSTGLAAAVTFCVVHKHLVRFRFNMDGAMWRRMVGEVWPIALLLGCDVLLRRVAILILFSVRPASDVAQYSAAMRVVDLLGLLTTSLTGALLPRMAFAWEVRAKAGWRAYRHSLRYFILLSVGLTVGMLLVARPLVLLLLGAAYLDSLVPLRVLLLSFFLSFVGGPMGALLLVSKEQLIAFVPRALIITAVTVAVSLWLLPRYGIVAAAWISVGSSGAFLLAKNRAIHRLSDGSIPWLSFLARPVAAAAGMACMLWLLHRASLLLMAPLGALTYGLLLLLFKEFNAPEYDALREWTTAHWRKAVARGFLGRA
ncbi:MAG: flippase [Anaerolineae bacterium]|nr:flippase [Anaerolineae bacterium]